MPDNPEPVLVIHGVANRDEEAFKRKVEALNARVGPAWTLLPAFWGDLAADDDDDLFASLPEVSEAAVRAVRGEGDEPNAAWVRRVQAGLGSTDDTAVRGGDTRQHDRIAHILSGVAERSGTGGTLVRGGVRSNTTEAAIGAVLEQEMPSTRYLQHVDDPAVLESVGRVLGDAAVALEADQDATTGVAVRGGPGAEEATRGPVDFFKRKVSDVIHDLDEVVGRAVGGALGNANRYVRQHVGQGVVRFFGDVFVYSRNRAEIHKRMWQAIDAWPVPGYGTEQRPINVIAHSLGGVAVFDAALDPSRPLWIRNLVTFGSQAAFFHTVDRREQLAEFTTGNPVALPKTIGTWTNLWEPMDLLAFTAGVVFRFDPNGQPTDTRVNSGLSEIWDAKAWTHSAYWESDELVAAITSSFGR